MEWLFGQIHGLFGNQFLDKFRSGHIVDRKDTGIENMKAVWAEKIRENRMHFGEIKRGLAGCAKLKFPPNWSEFFALCRPQINVDAAVTEAMEQIVLRTQGKDTWSHPAIYWAAQKVGYFELATMTHAQAKARFAPILDDILAKGDIPEIPEHQPQIANDADPKPANPLSAERKAQLRQQLHAFASKAAGKADHRAWAKRILEREKQGDQTLMPIQVSMAREALSAPQND
ncbi:MAG: hypothetical protein ACM3WS_03635 [Bacillota bacterium]